MILKNTSILLILLILVPKESFAQSKIGDVITDPMTSTRCRELINDRNEKLNIKQKTRSLIKRNQYLRKNTPTNKQSILNKLRLNYNTLKQEEKIIIYKIKSMEETIIRTGCPGIIL